MSPCWCTAAVKRPPSFPAIPSQLGFGKRSAGLRWLLCNSALCKALPLSFPINFPTTAGFPFTQVHSLTARQWTWLLVDPFLLDTTLYPRCSSMLTVSLFNRAAQRWIDAAQRESTKKRLQEGFLLNTPCQLGTVKNLHSKFQRAEHDRGTPSYQKEKPVMLTAAEPHALAIFPMFAGIQFWCW